MKRSDYGGGTDEKVCTSIHGVAFQRGRFISGMSLDAIVGQYFKKELGSGDGSDSWESLQ